MIPSKIDEEIISEIVKAVELLGGDVYLTSTISSWGDPLTDEEVLSLLRDWIKNRSPRIVNGQN